VGPQDAQAHEAQASGVAEVRIKTRKADKVSAQQREWCMHYATHGDPVEAYLHAYPKSKEWKRSSVQAEAYRLRCNALLMDLVLQIRSPVMRDLHIDYQWTLRESARQYYAAAYIGDIDLSIKALKLIAQLTALDYKPGERPRDNSNASRLYAESEITDGELVEFFSRTTGGTLIEGAVTPVGEGEGNSSVVANRFRELLSRAPTSPPSGVDVQSAPDVDRGTTAEGDDLRAAGGSEIDLFERLRAGLRRWEDTGDRRDSGEPHSESR
jgi:hypothetical protein